MTALEAYHGLFSEWFDSCYCFVCLSKQCLLPFELFMGSFLGIAVVVVVVVELVHHSIDLTADSRIP